MNSRDLALHVLHVLAQAQIEGRRVNLETLTEDLRVRRGDVRRAVSALDREGYADALRMRPTLRGFALGRSLLANDLPALRRPKLALVTAA
jgi:DNA-binding IclR family transcriptional regulator